MGKSAPLSIHPALTERERGGERKAALTETNPANCLRYVTSGWKCGMPMILVHVNSFRPLSASLFLRAARCDRGGQALAGAN